MELGWDGIARALRVNLDGTLAVLRAVQEASHDVAAVVRAGGLEEYGAGPTPYREGQREAPISPYSASQVAATHFCQMLQPDTAAAIITLRPALVYGPGQGGDFFIPSLIRSCLANVPFDMTSGVQGRDGEAGGAAEAVVAGGFELLGQGDELLLVGGTAGELGFVEQAGGGGGRCGQGFLVGFVVAGAVVVALLGQELGKRNGLDFFAQGLELVTVHQEDRGDFCLADRE